MSQIPTAIPESNPAHLAKLKEELAKARDVVRQELYQRPALEIARLYSERVEALLVTHVDAIARQLNAEHMRDSLAIVATGGFGRRELVLYSDIDFCVITKRATTTEQEAFIKAVLYPLWDLRVDLGYFVHSIEECLGALGDDLEKSTAFVETRHLWGDKDLTLELQERVYSRLHKHHIPWFIGALREEMRQRHGKSGNTLFLLEPDLKNARGGLRDVHQIMWMSFAQYGSTDFEILQRNGLISESEQQRLLEAWSFLLEARNTLHIAQNRRVDVLTLERQVAVSRAMKFDATEAALPEEHLMRSFYDHALVVDRICRRLLQYTLEATPGTQEYKEESVSKRLDRDFMRSATQIWIDEHHVDEAVQDPFWQMRLFYHAAQEGLEPTEETLRLVVPHLHQATDAYRKSREARTFFLGVLSSTKGRISETLRAMHRCGLLVAYFPEFGPVRNLPRIDHYHQFTVDEHLIRCVGECEELMSRTAPAFTQHAAAVAREILRPDLLNLSLLIHDVGKGEGRGHVIRGRHAIQRLAERLNFRPIEQELLRNLVANHQKMSHMALRRDIDDPSLARELAETVGDPENLKMLYVHTVCDIRGVSGESWNEWRGKLLALLFDRTLDELRGIKRERGPMIQTQPVHDEIWTRVTEMEPAMTLERGELEHFLSDMPDRYLRSVSPIDAARHYLLAHRLSDARHVVFRVDSYEDSNYVEITFLARAAPGLFSTLCGALASKRINILSAQIYTAASGEAVDIFQVEVPPAIRTDVVSVLDRLCERIDKVLRTGQQPEWVKRIDRTPVPMTSERMNLRPPRVDINNEMSPTHTVIEISAPDRPGLLSDVAGVLDRQGVNVDLAFIATESYQVVDVFYVTDLETNKIQGAARLNAIKDELAQVVTPSIPE
ncbi:[protein-PII] uridylyltransferase [bacterium]|nr:[protein-PII] uridylyltransferase [bacterium]